jgi:23S rRNA pseudouridine1911/1915/1917 synthase
MPHNQFVITPEYDGSRLDVVLADSFKEYSRVFMQKALRKGLVTLHGSVVSPSYRAHAGEVFSVPDWKELTSPSAALRLPSEEKKSGLGEGFREPDIIFEDESLMVIDKPVGVVVHAAPSHHGATLIDWVVRHWGKSVTKVFTDPERLGLVHRLDKETSGVLLMAKTVESQTALSRQFGERSVRKIYRALVEGVPSAAKGIVSAPIGRSRKNPARMAVTGSGRPSETDFRVEASYGSAAAELELEPKTGRTHQIRVHCAAIGHPILGDQAYGSHTALMEKYNIRRPMLHACKLEINHPVTSKRMCFNAPLPADFKDARKRLRNAAAVLAIMCLTGLSALHADERSSGTDAAPAAPAKPHHRVPESYATAKQVHHLEKEISSLGSEINAFGPRLDALRQQVADLEKGMEAIGNFSQRISDVEHALADINSKAVRANVAAEDSKTQLMDISRQVKTMQNSVEQLRDEVSRLKSEAGQRAVQQEAVPVESVVPSSGTR